MKWASERARLQPWRNASERVVQAFTPASPGRCKNLGASAAITGCLRTRPNAGLKRGAATGLISAMVATALLAGCVVGPKYQRPAVQAPTAYKTQGPWRVAAPKDSIPKGQWWEIFGDAELNGYEQQLLKANQSLVAAQARLAQARSLAKVSSADLFPQFSTDPNAGRERYSANRPAVSIIGPRFPLTQSYFEIPFTLSYEPDLFGKYRKSLEASNASLQSTAADLQNTQLVLAAELAADYFSLRELDAEIKVVQESVDIEQKGLQLVEYRHNGGIASGLDLAQQQTLLDSTITQLHLVQQQRANYEHAIAVLTGNPASTFSVPVAPLNGRCAAHPGGSAFGLARAAS